MVLNTTLEAGVSSGLGRQVLEPPSTRKGSHAIALVGTPSSLNLLTVVKTVLVVGQMRATTTLLITKSSMDSKPLKSVRLRVVLLVRVGESSTITGGDAKFGFEKVAFKLRHMPQAIHASV